MPFKMIDAVQQQFSPDFIAKTSSYFVESETGIIRALSGTLPAVLGAITNKTSTGTTGAEEFFIISKDSYCSGILNRPDNFFTDEAMLMNKGLKLLYGFMGDKIPGIINAISNFSGIRKSSAGSLLSMVAAISSAIAGKHAADNKLTASDLASLLNVQQSATLNSIPPKLDCIINILGLPGNVETSSFFSTDVKKQNKKEKKLSWLTWLFVQ